MSRYDQTVEEFKESLATVRTGRASSALVEDIEVEAYDSQMRLKELAAIAVPEARQLLVTPWDRSVVDAIEKALQVAGFNPSAEGEALRVNLPPLTHEDRERLIKEVGEKMEEARVKVKGIRRDEIGEVERLERKKQLSEDEAFAEKKKIEEEVKAVNNKIAELAEEKRQQLELT